MGMTRILRFARLRYIVMEERYAQFAALFSIRRDHQDGGPIMKRLGMLGIIGGAAILTAVPLSLQWSQKNVALSLDSAEAQDGRQRRRALQVSAEGFTEGHIAAHTAARLTQVLLATAMDCTPAMAIRPTPATTYLTEQATPHLTASTAAATPKLTSVYNQATPHRTDRFSTEGARRVGLGHLRRTRRAMQVGKSPAAAGRHRTGRQGCGVGQLVT